MKLFLEKFGFWLLVLVVISSGAVLLFEDLMSGLGNILKTDVQKVDESGRVLRVAYLFAPLDLNPYGIDLANKSRLIDVYEPLVAVDQNLSPIPALAITYGRISDREWQLKLRKGVFFHDNSELGIDDVIFSLKTAQNSAGMANLMDNIESFKILNEETLQIITKKADPLFLNKLSRLMIIPDGMVDYSSPIGTGPYSVEDSSDLSNISYIRNNNYWGQLAYFERAEILAINSKNDRVNAIVDGNIDFLVNVPPDAVEEIKSKGIKISTIPSLEVGFVMFNFNDSRFSQKNMRMAVARSLNKEAFLDLAFGFAKTLNQFVSNGVFGYDPDLQGVMYDLNLAAKDFGGISSAFEKIRIDFYYPENLKLLGQYFKEQLAQIGFDTNLNALSDQDLQQKMQDGGLGFYYLGWRHDSGDAIGLLKAILHSKVNGYGEFNGMNYSNKKVDQLIEKSEVNFDLEERLKDMQEIMRIVIEEDVVGVPLFETESIFAFQENLKFRPRVDSQVFISKITE